jgi:hypothetical protein
MAVAVSRRLPAAEAWARTRASPCGISVGQSGTVAGFSLSSSVLSRQYHSTVALYTHTSPGGQAIGPLVAAVQRQSHPIDMNKVFASV